jgi:hypothetical protein
MVCAAIAATVVRLMPLPRDGSSPRRAVVLHVPKDKVTDAEWDWWQKHYPDAGLLPIIHSMNGVNGRIYSRYLISTPKGKKEVWFETTMKDDAK